MRRKKRTATGIQRRLCNIRQSAAKKLSDCAGESIVETLVTMIILSLAVVMLSGAIVTSAKVNQKADNTDTAFTTNSQAAEDGVMTVTDGSGNAASGVSLGVNVYKTENGYIYYEPQS